MGESIEGILIEWEDGFKSSSVSPSRRVLWVLLTHFTFNWTLFKFIRLYSTLKLLKIFKKILNHPKWQATLGRSHACSIIGSDSSAIFEKWTTSNKIWAISNGWRRREVLKFRYSDPIETSNTTTKTLNSPLIKLTLRRRKIFLQSVPVTSRNSLFSDNCPDWCIITQKSRDSQNHQFSAKVIQI